MPVAENKITLGKGESLAYFNLLKFFGALGIVMMHSRGLVWGALGLKQPFTGNAVLRAVSHNSGLATAVFFIISGILFAVAYEKKIVKGMPFDYFFLKRMIRIYPVLFVTSVFMYVSNLLLHHYNNTLWHEGSPLIMDLVYDILFAGKVIYRAKSTNNGVIWYLNVLLFCYIVAFILARLADKHGASLAFLLPVVIGVGIRYNGGSALFITNTGTMGLIAFFVGVLLGKYFDITRGGVMARITA